MAEEQVDWNKWLAEHIKTCDQCNRSFNEVDGDGMCEVAFKKFKELLREYNVNDEARH